MLFVELDLDAKEPNRLKLTGFPGSGGYGGGLDDIYQLNKKLKIWVSAVRAACSIFVEFTIFHLHERCPDRSFVYDGAWPYPS